MAAQREWRLLEGDRVLAVLQATGDMRGDLAWKEVPKGKVQLSRFAVLRRDQEVGMVLECPLGKYRLVRMDALVFAWVMGLGQDEPTECGLKPESKEVLGQWLATMNALWEEGKAEDATLAHWEFHDLLFHAQSRPGRRTGRIQPYRWREVFGPLPLIQRGMGEWQDLPEPERHAENTNFWDVLASRRSRRAFSEQALSLTQLSTFLHHACRVQSQRPDELGGISFRPSPSAGALHGLEIYLFAHHCEGLERGLYHYEPLGHGLERLPLHDGAKLDVLGEQARRMAASASVPPAYFISTARFRRYQWKYAQLAYSVMLKDLGSLHQTMSLCAEALGLASVILGDTPSDPFMELGGLAGLNWLAESPVGSFSLGWPR